MHLLAALAAAACGIGLPSSPAGLPAPVLVETSCGGYAITPDGRVTTAPRPRLDTSAAQIDRRFGHIVVIRDGKIVWRSRRTFPWAMDSLASVAIGYRDVAFSFMRGRLWVASLNGTEHPIARHEGALGWTKNNDLLTLRRKKRRSDIFVRREDGSNPRVVGHAPRTIWFDDATGSVFYVTASARLIRSDGRSSARLADLGELGNRASIDFVDHGVIALTGSGRLVVLRLDGSVFASTSMLSGPISFVPTRDRIAFVTRDLDTHVFVLGEGATSATEVLREQVRIDGCGGPSLSWHGGWLLYVDGPEGKVLALDSDNLATRIDLTETVARLPGVSRDPLHGQLAGFSTAVWA